MNLNANKFSLSGAGTVAILYVVCALVVWLAPDLASKLIGNVTHLVNIQQLLAGAEITLQGVLLGLVQVVVYTYIALFIFAWLYNKLVE